MITINKTDGTKRMLNGSSVETVDAGNGMTAIFTMSGAQICVTEDYQTVAAAIESNSGTLTEFVL